MNIITEPLIQFLYWLYQMTDNLGLAIVILTLLIRGVLLPLTLPAIKSQKKIRELQPQLDEIKRKHKDDKTALSQAQMALYKENKINPLAGCLPYLVQFGVLIALYQVLREVLGNGTSELIQNVTFLGFDMTSRDTSYILPLLAAGLQLLLSLMIIPGADTRNIVPDESTSKSTQDLNKKEENLQDMATSMQRQMMFVMPIMTGVFAASFPAGLSLYWVVTTAFSVVQQWFTTGPGGLAKFIPGMTTKSVNWPAAIAQVQRENNSLIDKSIKNGEKSNKKTKTAESDFASAFMSIADTTKKTPVKSEKKKKSLPKKRSGKKTKSKKSK